MKSNKKGQTMVEYIIIVVIVAIAAIAIFGVFGDTITEKLSGGIVEMGGDSGAAQAARPQGGSANWMKTLKADGAGN